MVCLLTTHQSTLFQQMGDSFSHFFHLQPALTPFVHQSPTR
jgi:hypothetical protein